MQKHPENIYIDLDIKTELKNCNNKYILKSPDKIGVSLVYNTSVL